MADFIFDSFTEDIGDGTIDMDNDTFMVALFTNEALPASTYSSYDTGGAGVGLTADKTEVANGNGYTTGGVALASVTWSQAAGTCTFDAADSEWTAATFAARYAVIYSTTAAANELVCLIDFGAEKTVTAGTFTITWNASGIFTLAQA
uniref:Putative structural protein n=1 Tax=viral metagenome TaxID=1070528 RepID=A0A6M3J5B2_9ZZZZ